MSTATPLQPWEPLNIPIADPADLAVIVAAAESAAERALWQVLNIRAARIEALAQEARAAVARMTELLERASRPGWDGENAVSTVAYRAEEVASMARQCRRQFTTYQRHRARLEAKNSAV